MGEKFNRVFKSVTSDNGSEASRLGKVLNELGSEGYYTHPYSAYERGTNERANRVDLAFFTQRERNKQNIESSYKEGLKTFAIDFPEGCLTTKVA
uniref:hypothetical protein n=1 Tax=Caldicellulosiruptor changbaiensis TaxID=1222016 RepID=UPI001F49C9C9|nr:hypothetical protein [Caldicellulosiruptor changbaiensis]